LTPLKKNIPISNFLNKQNVELKNSNQLGKIGQPRNFIKCRITQILFSAFYAICQAADHRRADWLGYWDEFVQKACLKKISLFMSY